MANKKAWMTPQLKVYGSVEAMTEQFNFNKGTGSGDSVTFSLTIIGGPPISVTVGASAGGSITRTS